MVTVFKVLYYFVLIFAALIPMKHALHMFQQNRYELKRYMLWIKENYFGGFRRALIPALIICAVAFACTRLSTEHVLYVSLAIATLLAIVLIYRETKAQYIKPLVYTGRVKRQIVVMAILYLCIQAILLYLFRRLNIWYMLAFSYFGPWALVFPVAIITAPIEHAAKQWYINDAKRILNEHSDLVTIGITGSYGKTTTKNVVNAVLGEHFNTLMTPASYNTPMGITITIRELLKPIHKVFVCEMGADHVGDITELMEFVKPSIGVVTSIGPQHLTTFKTQENIIHEKMQVIELLPSDGLGVLNYDNEFIREYKIQNKVPTVTYGIRNRDVDYYADEIKFSENGTQFTLLYKDEKIPFETRLLGELNILNILSAIAIAHYLKVDWATIQRAIKQMKQVEHRLELKKINGYTFIDDAFNANPSGAKMALDVLAHMKGKRFIVTPGMIELGDRQEELNKLFGKQMLNKVDEVLLVGAHQVEPIYQGLEEVGFDMNHVHVVDTVKEAFAYVYQHATKEDVILLENDLPDAFNH